MMTCRRRLKSLTVSNKTKKKPLLTRAQKKKRLAWATVRTNRTNISKESTFNICIGDGRGTVIRKKSEAFRPDCLKRTIKFPSGVMFWGCMSSKGVSDLCFSDGIVNSEKYQHILRNQLLSSMARLHPHECYIATRWS